MSSLITPKVLKHLAKLARVELSAREEKKIQKDLEEILAYFKELEELDTTTVVPMNGGTSLQNIFREDGDPTNTLRGQGRENFPKEKNDLLSVPPIFHHD